MNLILEGVFSLWFLLVALSLIFTVYDIKHMPISWVQKLGWVLVILYSGPIGLFFYLLTCRSPGKGLHDVYTQAHWKQSVNSEVHCLAGDATGIILAAIILSFIDIANGTELIVEYLSAFIFGWFIFQAGMMVNMYKSYGEAVKKTFFAETVSMNFVMIGMIPTMIILMSYIEHGRDPKHMAFWFIMGVATIIGGIIAYPINSWLVKNKLKHGCMTIPETTDVKHEHKKAMSEHSCGAKHQHGGHGEHKHDEHQHHDMQTLPLKKSVSIVIGTFVLLAIAVIITIQFVPINV